MHAPTEKKSPPPYLFALGQDSLPETLVMQARGSTVTFRFVKLFKHDFFAATGLYRDQAIAPAPADDEAGPGLVVLKIQRTRSFCGFPLAWLGRRVARNEIRVLESLQGIRGVPEFLGRHGTSGFMHAFVPGAPLEPTMPFTAAFFDNFRDLLAAIHARHAAYVDTNKRENILLGTDGRPWLIDFQISYRPRRGARCNFLSRALLRRLQRADWYHFYKHKTRLLPAACTPEDFAHARRRGFLHWLHRMCARPLIQMRRWFLSRYRLEKVK
jgi:hypothetical protein